MTTLPVDYRKRPWKPKYLTDETPVLNRWFIFGRHSDGTVDISDTDDVFIRVPRNVAGRIIAARDIFCDVIEQELCE